MSQNPTGRNQHNNTIMANHETWCPIIQCYLDRGVPLFKMANLIKKETNLTISKRSISRLIEKHELKTARRPRMSEDEMKEAIVGLTNKFDPLGKWGNRLIKEELTAKGIHVPRQIIEDFQRQRDPEAAQGRWTGKRKLFRKGLLSPGPNEEWCVDGHEKIRECLGIDIWGIVDKFSRYELGLWAVPNARQGAIPVALFLSAVKKAGGVPLQVTSDKGSENGQLAALQTILRTYAMPTLTIEDLPPARFVKSVRNITRERAWRPLYHKDLQNIVYVWSNGQLNVGYKDGDYHHKSFGTWVWAHVVQACLDHIKVRSQVHKIRTQKNVFLPTGDTSYNFYHHPEDYEGENQLIPIDPDVIDQLMLEHPAPDLNCFGTKEFATLAENIYKEIGSPGIEIDNAWGVWRAMMNVFECLA